MVGDPRRDHRALRASVSANDVFAAARDTEIAALESRLRQAPLDADVETLVSPGGGHVSAIR